MARGIRALRARLTRSTTQRSRTRTGYRMAPKTSSNDS